MDDKEKSPVSTVPVMVEVPWDETVEYFGN